jgi:hypothetical protein
MHNAHAPPTPTVQSHHVSTQKPVDVNRGGEADHPPLCCIWAQVNGYCKGVVPGLMFSRYSFGHMTVTNSMIEDWVYKMLLGVDPRYPWGE